MTREDKHNERARTHSRRDSTNDTNILRPAELHTLDLVGNGDTLREAAAAQGLAYYTIRDHIDAARDRLGARNTTHAVRLAIRTGQLDP